LPFGLVQERVRQLQAGTVDRPRSRAWWPERCLPRRHLQLLAEQIRHLFPPWWGRAMALTTRAPRRTPSCRTGDPRRGEPQAGRDRPRFRARPKIRRLANALVALV
jgi:hypothetical protein